MLPVRPSPPLLSPSLWLSPPLSAVPAPEAARLLPVFPSERSSSRSAPSRTPPESPEGCPLPFAAVPSGLLNPPAGQGRCDSLNRPEPPPPAPFQASPPSVPETRRGIRRRSLSPASPRPPSPAGTVPSASSPSHEASTLPFSSPPACVLQSQVSSFFPPAAANGFSPSFFLPSPSPVTFPPPTDFPQNGEISPNRPGIPVPLLKGTDDQSFCLHFSDSPSLLSVSYPMAIRLVKCSQYTIFPFFCPAFYGIVRKMFLSLRSVPYIINLSGYYHSHLKEVSV